MTKTISPPTPPVPVGLSTYLAVAYAVVALVGVIVLIALGQSEASIGIALSSAGVLYKLIASRGEQAQTLSAIAADMVWRNGGSVVGTALGSAKEGEEVRIQLEKFAGAEYVDDSADERLSEQIAILGENAPAYDDLPDDEGDDHVKLGEN
jgi:hypothetical protein